ARPGRCLRPNQALGRDKTKPERGHRRRLLPPAREGKSLRRCPRSGFYLPPPPAREGKSQNADTDEGFYLPGRVVAVDLPGQGARVLVSRNHEALAIFDRLRTFTSGEVVSLRWQRG